ncbi:DNA adenine methylase [Marinilactibacillus sp. Marseille-P9653]|uniref:DNA adenine methylase n=1 Tax=Marinilactibacillus sp. Marseille-P9653 TaxID=2866583 RepID=UPI001CE44409|nr:DNA adenine methylase [Marinilactibacillus sp. Marseille-P9653]
MRYLGNKTKLLPFIDEVIKKYNITGEVFADLFAGTSAVSDHMKGKYKIITNDFMYYSFVFSKAKTLNFELPKFEYFINQYLITPFEWLNSRKYTPDEHYFIYQNYSPKGDRQFFIEENAIKIDGMRLDIEELYQEKLLSEAEYYFLLASLLESVTKISNTSGTYEAFFKFWESRSNKPLVLSPLEMENSFSVDLTNISFNEDTNFLIRHIAGDIAYIDTPYTITQYASAYHILETIARYDIPEIAGKTGRRQNGRRMSQYSRKQLAKFAFEDMFRQLNFEHILISYSNQSLVPLDELVDLAKLFAVNHEVFIEEVPYREYKNLNSSQKGNGKKLNEVIIYFKKNKINIKSPLNYSGSKDTLLEAIYKELPQHVGTFVDAMGGAFNVGANVIATNSVLYNEYNPFVFEVMEMILTSDRKSLLDLIEKKIENYNLGNAKKIEYLNFRNWYNSNEKTPLNLFILHMFSFQNLIRFNGQLGFNSPVGNAGFNEGLRKRILNFLPKSPILSLKQGSYKDLPLDKFERDTVFYFDPPYLITTAEYNDGKRGLKGWDVEMEAELLMFLSKLDKLGFKFMLSNVMEHQGRINNLLKEWTEQHRYECIEIGQSGARYPRTEVLIKNY